MEDKMLAKMQEDMNEMKNIISLLATQVNHQITRFQNEGEFNSFNLEVKKDIKSRMGKIL